MSFTIAIIGAPASGKSTLTKFLTARLSGVTSFSVRAYFGRALHDGTEIGRLAEEYVRARSWIPDHLIGRAVTEALLTGELRPPLIFEGMPGNRPQAALLDQVLSDAGLAPPVAVHVDTDPDLCVRRSRMRLVCMVCDSGSWPADPHPEQPGRCRRCGETITARPADAPAEFHQRLQTYRRESPDLLTYYRPGRLITVDGSQPVESSGETVLAKLSGIEPRRPNGHPSPTGEIYAWRCGSSADDR